MLEAQLPFSPQMLDLSSASLSIGTGIRVGSGARTAGQAGALIFGPYWRLPRGDYRLTAHHRRLASGASHAVLHVWCGRGLERIASVPLAQAAITELTFTLARDVDDIEFVIMVDADAALEFYRYELVALTPFEAQPGEAVSRRDFGYNLPFRHIVSLGTHCYTASLLQRQEWKRFSGPFDWIFSTPAMVRHCITDDFVTLLDRVYYEPVSIEDRLDPHHNLCHHRFYREVFGVDFVFNHHDVLADEGYRYLQRCVSRFLAVACGSDPVLLLQTRREEPDAEDQFAATCALIEARYRSCTLNAIAVRPTLSPGLCPELCERRREGPHRLFDLTPVSRWEATAFEDPLDELVLARLVRFHRLKLDPPVG